MALDESALPELLDALRAGDGIDLIRDAVRLVMQELIELEVTDHIGAARYERSDTRTNERNGHRPRLLATQAGDIELKIPKLSHGSFFPSLLSPRRRIDQALHAVIMQAYIEGVSTRRVDDLVVAMRGAGGCPAARWRGSALRWTARWAGGARGHWTTSRSRVCSLRPPPAGPGSIAGWRPRRW